MDKEAASSGQDVSFQYTATGTGPSVRRSWLLKNAVSPYGLAIFSYLFFLSSCFIPPSIYKRYMMEPDLMFLDPATILFYTLCIASFLIGAASIAWVMPSSFVERRITTRISPTLFLMIPLTIGIGATLISLFLLVTYHPDIVVMLLAQQGADLKQTIAFDVTSSINLAPIVLTAIVWWAWWRLVDFGLLGWRRFLVKSTLVLGIVSVIAAATLILSRDILMMFSCGLAVLYLARRNLRKSVSFKFALRAAGAIALCVATLFFAFSFLRGVGGLDDQLYTLFGYTAASYNRLAAVVNGRLHYPFAGRGLYLSSFVAYNHTWNQIVPLNSILNWPNQLDDWNSQFAAVTQAGLDGTLIWSGAFGYIFADLGWFSFPFVFVYGVIYGVAWNWIKRGRALGVVLYPCFGFCALFWIGSNILLDSQRAVLFVAAVLLAAYELFCVKRDRKNIRPRATPS